MTVPWTAPIAAGLACMGVATALTVADTWLALSLLVAAAVNLILPGLRSPAPGQVASTATPPSAVHNPADVVEADVRQPREVA